MPTHRKLPLLLLIGLMPALAAALIGVRPASARVELKSDHGEAVWFFRACQPEPQGGVATWKVGPYPPILNQGSLRVQVANAYPGYQLVCRLQFANAGKFPIAVNEISVINPHRADLAVSANEAPGDAGKVLQPCGRRPYWGQDPASLPLDCQAEIEFALTVGPDVDENARLDFAVQVKLEAKPGGVRP